MRIITKIKIKQEDTFIFSCLVKSHLDAIKRKQGGKTKPKHHQLVENRDTRDNLMEVSPLIGVGDMMIWCFWPPENIARAACMRRLFHVPMLVFSKRLI